jgi:hypothetical protein
MSLGCSMVSIWFSGAKWPKNQMMGLIILCCHVLQATAEVTRALFFSTAQGKWIPPLLVLVFSHTYLHFAPIWGVGWGSSWKFRKRKRRKFVVIEIKYCQGIFEKKKMEKNAAPDHWYLQVALPGMTVSQYGRKYIWTSVMLPSKVDNIDILDTSVDCRHGAFRMKQEV